MLLKDVGIDSGHHDVVLAVDDERALLDLLQIAVAVCRGDRTPFSKCDELGLGDLGLRFWFAVQLSRGDPLKPGLARRVESISRTPRRLLPACAQLARPCRHEMGFGSAQKSQSRSLFRLWSHWPRSAALDAFSLAPASSSNTLTSGGADALARASRRAGDLGRRERQFVQILRTRWAQAVSRDSGTP